MKVDSISYRSVMEKLDRENKITRKSKEESVKINDEINRRLENKCYTSGFVDFK